LFKSYVFVYTELEKNFYPILNTNGVVKFISFQGSPAKVDQREIALVKLILGQNSDYIDQRHCEPVEPLLMGEPVTVIAGPLIGTQGKLISTRSGERMLIELETMQQNLLITIPSNFLIKTHQSSSMAV
jgi:transcription antitermination factor NusG